jgi:hypothetical protein
MNATGLSFASPWLHCICNFLCLFLTWYSEAAHLYKPSGCLWQVAPEYFDQGNWHPSTYEIFWCNLPWAQKYLCDSCMYLASYSAWETFCEEFELKTYCEGAFLHTLFRVWC